jgi:outer membrane protein W
MLKTTTILFSLLVLNIQIIKAQTLSAGPIIGLNMSKLTGANNTKYLAGASIGAFANYSVNEHVGIGAKFMYTQMGTAYDSGEYINRLHYLQMPITGIYFFGENGDKFRPKIYAGPYVGTLLNATYKGGTKITEANGGILYKKLDFGGVVGLGFNYLIQSKTWLNVDAGLTQGFTNVNEKAGLDLKNQSIGLNIGLSFPIN